MRTDIDEKTPLEEVKAPNVFERAKEEIEAIVEAIHPKKESESGLETKKEPKQDKADSKSGMEFMTIKADYMRLFLGTFNA